MRWRKMVVVGVMAWLLAALALDARGRRPPPAGAWEAIVVAGCHVEPNGEPSDPLRRRVELAARLYHEGRAPRVIFTGGIGRYPPSEAASAARYARALGVPEAAMGLEETSTSTEGNAAAAAALYPLRRVLVVTDTYHALRAQRVFARYFPEVDAAGSRSGLALRLRGALREPAALAWYALRGRL